MEQQFWSTKTQELSNQSWLPTTAAERKCSSVIGEPKDWFNALKFPCEDNAHVPDATLQVASRLRALENEFRKVQPQEEKEEPKIGEKRNRATNAQIPQKVQRCKSSTPKCKKMGDIYTDRERDIFGAIQDASSQQPLQEPHATHVAKFGIVPSRKQKKTLQSYFDGSRNIYNQCVADYRVEPTRKWTERQKNALTKYHEDNPKVYTPNQILQSGSRDFKKALAVAKILAKQKSCKKSFVMHFKSKAKSTRYCVELGSRAVRVDPSGKGFWFFSNKNKEIFKARGSKQHLMQRLVSHLDKGLKRGKLSVPHACRLVYYKASGKYELHIPLRRPQQWYRKFSAESQDSEAGKANTTEHPRILAIDPGVRTFVTGYSPNGHFIEAGKNSHQILCSKIERVDFLRSKLAKVKDFKQADGQKISKEKRHRMKRNLRALILRISQKLKNMVRDAHYKLAHFLSENYDIVCLPGFQTKDMVKRGRTWQKDQT